MTTSLRVLVMALVVATTNVARSELPPSVYEEKQRSAGECLMIEVLQVEVEPGGTTSQQKVTAVALVTKVLRSKSGVLPDEIVNIRYTINDRPEPFVGPGEIPLLTQGEKTIAYLDKSETLRALTPAAGIMSFSNFSEAP